MSDADMTREPFDFFPWPALRSTAKPRSSGLTMVMDCGMPLHALEDWLEIHAPYVDLMKLAVGTARLYGEDQLRRKLQIYSDNQVRPFLGGMFLEYVLHAQGMAAVTPYCREAARLGIEAIEVSDNIVPLTTEERTRIIKTACDHGLEVHGEVGSKFTANDGTVLSAQVNECLEAGASIVLVEGAEMLRDGVPDVALCDALRQNLDLKKVMFELGGPWIPETTVWSTYALRLFLIQTFGPDVNLANIDPDVLLDTEATRIGLGDPLEHPEALAAHSALRCV